MGLNLMVVSIFPAAFLSNEWRKRKIQFLKCHEGLLAAIFQNIHSF